MHYWTNTEMPNGFRKTAKKFLKNSKKVFQLWQQAAESREEDGSLTYCAANICIHYFTREFLERVIAEHEHDLVSTPLNFSCFVTDTKYATMFALINHFQSS